MRPIILLLSLALASCRQPGEHSHVNDTGGGHPGHGSEIPTIDHTIWTDKTELFAEFPALVVGETSRFAAHFTVLEKHQPVRAGSLTVSLIKDGKGVRQTAEAPSSPGIFTPALQPQSAGLHDLVFELKAPGFEDKITIPNVRVFESAQKAIDELGTGESESGVITFLKEQAWKMEFETAPVTRGEVFEVISTSGSWQYAPGSSKSISANATGVVNFAKEDLTAGAPVKQGELLMTLSGEGLTTNNLQTEIAKARSSFEQAKAEYERKKELYRSRIVPRAEFEQVEEKFQVAKAHYETLTAGYGAGGKKIRAPFDGFVKNLHVRNGDYAEQGAILLSIANQKSYLLEIQLSASYASELEPVQNIWYRKSSGRWSNLNETGGSVLSVGKTVGKEQPMLSIFARVNEAIEMPEGSFTEVEITYGEAGESAVIPVSALLEDYGSYSVIVQLSGERFERRQVQIGKQNGKWVAIKQGLNPGEVVVTKGAYQVKMASMSGTTPAHGHEH